MKTKKIKKLIISEWLQQKRFYIILLIILPIILLSANIFNPHILEVGDFEISISSSNFTVPFSLWNNQLNVLEIGNLSGWLFSLPFHLLANLSIPMLVISKMLILVPFIIASIGSFILSRFIINKHSKDIPYSLRNFFSFSIAIIYTFNPWSLGRVEHYGHWTAYCILPFFVFLFLKFIEEKEHKAQYLVYAALCFVVGTTSIHFLVYYTTIVIILSAIYLFKFIYLNKKKLVFRHALWLFIFILLVILLSSYWLFPVIMSFMDKSINFQPSYFVNAFDVKYVNRDLSMFDVLLLKVDASLMFIIVSIILWGILIFGFALKSFREYKLAVLLIIIAGLLIPLIFFYWPTMYEKIVESKYGWLFRDPQRTNGLLPLAWLIGLSMSLPLIASKFFKKRINLNDSRFKKSICILIPVILICLSTALYVADDVTTHLFNHYRPSEIPKDFEVADEYLQGQDHNYKALWLPTQFDARKFNWSNDKYVNNFIDASSGLSTFSSRNLYVANYLRYTNSQLVPSKVLAKYFNFLNLRFLVHRKDLVSKASAQQNADIKRNLLENENISQISENDFLDLYNLNETSAKLQMYKNFWLAIGGLDTLEHLNASSDFDPRYNPIIFLDQGFQKGEAEDIIKNASGIIANDATFNDLIMGLQQADYELIFNNVKSQGWRYVSSYNPLHGEWYKELEKFQLTNHDFDYNKGILTCKETCSLKQAIDIVEDGQYILLARILKNGKGSKLNISINNTKIPVETLSNSDSFEVVNLGEFNLHKGANDITIEALNGFNAINFLTITSVNKFAEVEKMLIKTLDQKPIIYTGNASNLGYFQEKNIDFFKKQANKFIINNSDNINDPLAVKVNDQPYNENEITANAIDFQITPSEPRTVIYADQFYTPDAKSLKSSHFDAKQIDITVFPNKKFRLISKKIAVGENERSAALTFKYNLDKIGNISARILFYTAGSDKPSNTHELLNWTDIPNKLSFASKIGIPENISSYVIEIFFQAENSEAQIHFDDFSVMLEPKSAIEYKIVPINFTGFFDSNNILFQSNDDLHFSISDETRDAKLIVTSLAFHPSWIAKSEKTKISPIPAYSFLNSYLINQTSNDQYKIQFESDRYFHTGLLITFSTIMASTVFLYRTLKKTKLANKPLKN